jgi:cytohesin
LHFATDSDHAHVAEVLLKTGHPVDAVNEYGQTPLYHAANYGKPKAARVLIKHKADVNIKMKDGMTPLHEAAYPMRGRAEVVRLLLAAGADPKARNEDGQTPLATAKEYLGDPNTRDGQEDLKQIIALLTAATARKK